MSGFKIPLDFSTGSLFEKSWWTNVRSYDSLDDSIKESINDFLYLLVSSPNGSFIPDYRFGFSLRNCYFENPNARDEIKGKKIGGKSDNINNYAKEFEKTLKVFEPRLQNIEVKTEFEKKLAKMTISVTGTIIDTKKEYKQDITLFIWRKNEDI